MANAEMRHESVLGNALLFGIAQLATMSL